MNDKKGIHEPECVECQLILVPECSVRAVERKARKILRQVGEVHVRIARSRQMLIEAMISAREILDSLDTKSLNGASSFKSHGAEIEHAELHRMLEVANGELYAATRKSVEHQG